MPAIKPLVVDPGILHAYHLYVIRMQFATSGHDRTTCFKTLRQKGVAVNVHYIPVHLHPYYRKTFKIEPGLCPVTEAAYEQILSLPIFATMRDDEVEFVIDALADTVVKSNFRDLPKE
jgi:perosamine synthetase